MKIELLQGSLPIAENPGLDSTDPRFDEIITLTQAGKYAEAANQCEALISEGIFDIRLICYFLYGHWLESGLIGLLDVFDILNHLIADNLQAIGPTKNQAANMEKSMDWLLRILLKSIKYEESKNSPTWNRWQTSISTEDTEQILASGKAFRICTITQLADKAAPVIDQWSKIEQWLRVFQQLQYSKSSANEDETSDTATPSAEIASPSPEIMTKSKPAKADAMEFERSYPLQVLMKKLAGFERLLSENRLSHAALVAEDINLTLQNFDPKLYFPKLFENFVRLQAIHFEELSAYLYQHDEQHWQIMQEWIKVDLDGFIDNQTSMH